MLEIVCPHCSAVNRLPQERLGDGPKCGKCQQMIFTGVPLSASSQQLSRHIHKNEIPVVVDFWAEWCGPCKMMAPVFAEACIQLEPRFRLIKIDTESEQAVSAQFNIRSIPSLMIFKNGVEVARQAGAMPLAPFVQWVQRHA